MPLPSQYNSNIFTLKVEYNLLFQPIYQKEKYEKDSLFNKPKSLGHKKLRPTPGMGRLIDLQHPSGTPSRAHAIEGGVAGTTKLKE